MRIKYIFLLLIMCSAGYAMQGCVNVKQYQKSRLNDAEMELTARKVERGETNFQTYREGSGGANGGKAGGGCGCN